MTNGQLVAQGTLPITDLNAGESGFRTTVVAAQGASNWGTLTLAADGSYTYAVTDSDARVQALGQGQTHVDTFTITALDGTTKEVSFTINGVDDNHAPTVVANAPTSFAAATGSLNTVDGTVYGQGNAPFSFDVKTLFTDPDGDALTFSATGLPDGFALGTDGVIRQASARAQTGVGDYTVKITATDTHNASTVITVPLVVAIRQGYGQYQVGQKTGSSGDDVMKFDNGQGYGMFGSLTVDTGAGNDKLVFGAFAAGANGQLTVNAGTGADSLTFDFAAGTGGILAIDLGAGDQAKDTLTFAGSVKANVTSFEVGTNKISFSGQSVTLDHDVNNHVHFTGTNIDVTLSDVVWSDTLKRSDFMVDTPPVVATNAPTSLKAAAGNLNTADGTTTGAAKAAFSYDLTKLFTDADGDKLSISLDKVPAGFTLDSSGVLKQTSATDPVSAGDYTLKVTADDGHGGTTSTTLTLTVALDQDFGHFIDSTVNGSSTSDIIKFADGTGVFGYLAVGGGAGDDTITFGDYAGTQNVILKVNGGDGNDTINFGDYAAEYNGTLSVDGGNGDDTITFGNFGSNSAAYFGGSITVNGGDGNDTITFGAGSGFIAEQLNVLAGNGADNVRFGILYSDSVSIDLGANDKATDTVTFEGAVTATVTSFEVGTDKISFSGQSVTLDHDGNDHVHFSGNNIDVTLSDVTYNANMKVSDFLLS
ncbi:MAG: hypothetical protein EKK41_09670 [Hyphomicrobiales bacterium]|nr:MAG: hypothetical protein EKK41_09670 [Hyphomicrobiales bacterium]